MKIDHALIYYLLKHKELKLQGIGVFNLEGTVTEPASSDKPFVIPADAISFTYNPRIGEDPDLIAFISETTGKIKPLASADLDSYLTLGRQFINIGKPMILPNIGTIEKTGTGELIFKGGEYVMERITPNKVTTEVEEKEEVEPASFSDFPSQKKNTGKGFLYLFILFLIGLTIWAVWKYAFNENKEDTITHTVITADSDNEPESTTEDSPEADTSKAGQQVSLAPGNDSVGFQIVVGIYKTLAAGERRIEDMKLSGRNVILYTSDSINFKVAEPFPNSPLSDSNRIKDSMRGYYGDRDYLIEQIRR